MRPRAVTPLLAWAFVALTVSHATDPTQKTGFWKRVFSTPEAVTANRLFFNVSADISLPGPLPGPGPILIGGSIEIPVADGVATTDWAPDSEAAIDSDRDAPPTLSPSEVSTDAEDRFRARFLADGKLLMEKRCKRCKKGWSKKWKLRIPGNASAPPLITDARVYFGAPDNRIYCLQKSNGYRIWDVDVGSRISRPLVFWSGTPAFAPVDGTDLDSTVLVLALPDNGARLIALDAQTGQEVARFELPRDGGRIRAIPLKMPDGKIVIAMEKYNTEEASLIVLELSRASTFAEADSSDSASADDPPEDDDGSSRSDPPASLREKQDQVRLP